MKVRDFKLLVTKGHPLAQLVKVLSGACVNSALQLWGSNPGPCPGDTWIGPMGLAVPTEICDRTAVKTEMLIAVYQINDLEDISYYISSSLEILIHIMHKFCFSCFYN
jgi:hypothetical protein